MKHLLLRSLVPLAALAAACGPDTDDKSLDQATEATLGFVVRDADGQPISGVETEIGFQNTVPDLAGMARYPELLAGRLTVRASAPGYTGGTAVTEQTIGAFGSAKITLAPLEPSQHDVGAEIVIGDAEITVTIPAGSLLLEDGTPAAGNADFGWYRGGDADPVVPGIRTWLRDDQFEEPLDIFAAFELGLPVQEDADGVTSSLALGEELQATVRWVVGDAWPHAEDASLGLYAWDRTEGYWKLSRRLTVVDGAVEATTRSFGWLAIAAQPPATACVSGRVTGPGGAVSGIEITAADAGYVGVQRVITGEDGTFCAPLHPGADVALTAWGWSAPGDTLGTGAASTVTGAAATCGGCVDVGDVPMTWARDMDGDVFWAGEGDCDDGDPTVNPIDSGDICIGG